MNARNLLLGLILLSGQISYAEILPKLTINETERFQVNPGEVMEWRLQFVDSKTGTTITKFQAMAGRYMHLIIFKDDFSRVTHVHPTLIGDSGVFSIVLNQKPDDPDSWGAENTIQEPGRYFVFAEIFPSHGGLVPAAQFVRFEIQATGTPQAREIRVNEPNTKCEYVSYVNVAERVRGEPPKETVAQFGSTYRLKLHSETIHGTAGNLVRFHLGIDQWDKKAQAYLPIRGLQEFLGMHGHLFLASVDEEPLRDRLFVHGHSMVHEGLHDNHMIFNYFDRGEFGARKLLRTWFQFKHDDEIRTAEFTFGYDAHLEHRCHSGH